MKDYYSCNSKNVSGHDTGISWVTRLSALSIQRPQTVEWHAHRDTELLFCLKGSLQYEFRDRPAATLRAGTFMVIPPGREHRTNGGVESRSRRFSIFLAKNPDRRRPLSAYSTEEYRDLLARFLARRQVPLLISSSHIRDMTRLADLIEKEDSISPLERLELRALVTLALSALQNAHETSQRPDTSADALMAEAEQWLLDRISTPVSVSDLVAHVGYGRSRFFSLFKAHTGLSPIDWLTQRRIERAKTLLDDTTLSIRKVANSVGFRTATFFARTFKLQTGVSPTDWRKTRANPSISVQRIQSSASRTSPQ